MLHIDRSDDTPETDLDVIAREEAMRAAEANALAEAKAEPTPAPATPPRRPLRDRLRSAWLAFRGVEELHVTALRNAAEQELAAHEMLDALGVPRDRYEKVFSLQERLGIFIDRLSERLHSQVENNMIYYNLCREVAVLLEAAPNASQFRIRAAILKLRAVTAVPNRQGIIQSLDGLAPQ